MTRIKINDLIEVEATTYSCGATYHVATFVKGVKVNYSSRDIEEIPFTEYCERMRAWVEHSYDMQLTKYLKGPFAVLAAIYDSSDAQAKIAVETQLGNWLRTFADSEGLFPEEGKFSEDDRNRLEEEKAMREEFFDVFAPLLDVQTFVAAVESVSPAKREAMKDWLANNYLSMHHDDNDFDRWTRVAIEIQPRSAKAWKKLSGSLYSDYLDGDNRKLKATIDAHHRYLEIKPEDKEMWQKLSEILELAHRYRDAIDVYRKLTQLEPDNFYWWYVLGIRLIYETKDVEGGMDAWRKALAAHDCPQDIKDKIKYQMDKIEHDATFPYIEGDGEDDAEEGEILEDDATFPYIEGDGEDDAKEGEHDLATCIMVNDPDFIPTKHMLNGIANTLFDLGIITNAERNDLNNRIKAIREEHGRKLDGSPYVELIFPPEREYFDTMITLEYQITKKGSFPFFHYSPRRSSGSDARFLKQEMTLYKYPKNLDPSGEDWMTRFVIARTCMVMPLELMEKSTFLQPFRAMLAEVLQLPESKVIIFTDYGTIPKYSRLSSNRNAR